MPRINLCISFVLVNFLFGCSGEVGNKDRAHIVVVGTAINMKSGAAVQSNDDIYFVDGMLSWEEHMLEKRLTVEGDLFVKTFAALPCPEMPADGSPPPPPPQRISPDFMQIIKNAKW